MKNKFLLYSLILYLFCSCREKEGETQNTSPVLRYPAYFGQPDLNNEKNPISEKGIALGQKLFFDPILSGNNLISCATCHLPALAFSDGVSGSTQGHSKKKLLRNSPPIFNMAWHNSFFWDGGAKDLESQALGPLESEDEMFQDLNELESELQNHHEYPALFEEVFHTKSINVSHVMKALAQYQKSLISYQSKYDQYLKKQISLSENETNGLSLFLQNCAACHKPEHFSDFDFHNNGLDSQFDFPNEDDQRWGRYRVTDNTNDIGKYKTPSLRNIELTAPYMHDGRIKTLQDVLEHYSSGIKNSPTLSPLIPTNGFNFSENEKENIIAFLKTLTDHHFINKHLSNE